MEFSQLADIAAHLDRHLLSFAQQYGVWTYVLCFSIIFVETGLVIAPLLPGDSLLFAAGSVAAVGELNPHRLAAALSVAAVLGDSLNYAIGRRMGPAVFRSENSRVFRREYLERTQGFFERHGGKTIVLARFIPVIRTFAPFVAGIGRMPYPKFLAYNLFGGVLWVALLVYTGYFFGTLPWVQAHFSTVLLAIVAVSVAPAVLEYARRWRLSRA